MRPLLLLLLSLLPAVGLSGRDTLAVDTVTHEVRAKKGLGARLGRIIKGFDEYDTDYIIPNYYNYTAMLQNTNFYQSFRLRAENDEGLRQSLTVAPSPTFKLGPYFGWRWIFLGYTFDISHLKHGTESTETSLSLYSSMIGVDLMYIRNTGDFTIRSASGFSSEMDRLMRGREFDGMNATTVGVNAYFVPGHRRFSYPAAFAQSTMQRRSAGSFIFGFNYLRQKVNFDPERLPEEMKQPGSGGEGLLIEEMKMSHVDYRNYSLSAGYAYNWAFARNCLFSISVTPSLGIKQTKGERIRGDQLWRNVRDLSFNCISRSALVWNNNHWFAGISYINYLHDYKKDAFSMLNTVHYLSFYVGFFFDRKSQYRNK